MLKKIDHSHPCTHIEREKERDQYKLLRCYLQSNDYELLCVYKASSYINIYYHIIYNYNLICKRYHSKTLIKLHVLIRQRLFQNSTLQIQFLSKSTDSYFVFCSQVYILKLFVWIFLLIIVRSVNFLFLLLPQFDVITGWPLIKVLMHTFGDKVTCKLPSDRLL